MLMEQFMYFICSHDQLANTLTKTLSNVHFIVLRSKLILKSLPMSLRGRISNELEDTEVTRY
jgi:hypothetical protein